MKARTTMWIVLAGAAVCCSGPLIAQSIDRVSVSSAGAEGNGSSRFPSVSADATRVAFWSLASNLVVNDTNGVDDVFVRDRTAGTTRRVSVSSSGEQGNGSSNRPALSVDGGLVAFHSDATNLVTGDTNDKSDVFVHNLATATTERVSLSSTGAQGNWDSSNPSISADGRLVAFESQASTLVFGDFNGIADIFVRDRSAATTVRVSVSSAGAEANSPSRWAAISADGQWVAFTSYASNLVAGDTNGREDVFIHDLASSTTTRVSVSAAGVEANQGCGAPHISRDGRYVAFSTYATTLTPAGGGALLKDRFTGAVTRIDVATHGAYATRAGGSRSISGDGEIVGFVVNSDGLTRGGTILQQLPYVHHRGLGVTTRVNVAANAEVGNGVAEWPVVSQDGRFAVFADNSTNLVLGDTNGTDDIFVRALSVPDWVTYGAGLTGTYSIPSIDIAGTPALGQRFTLEVSNSRGTATNAALILGLSQAGLPFFGGTVLVTPLLVFPVPLASGGISLPLRAPPSTAALWHPIYFQVIEDDPGAVWGLSFTPGLVLVIGV